MKKQRMLAWVLASSMILSSFSLNTMAQEDDASVSSPVDAVVSGSSVDVGGGSGGGSGSVGSDSIDSEEIVDTGLTAQAASKDEVSSLYTVAGPWKATTYGEGWGGAGDYTNYTEDNLSIKGSEDSVEIKSGKGKVGWDGSSEGMAAYYQEISADQDFTISATAEVLDYSASELGNNQTAFGLMIRDNIFVDEPTSSIGAVGNGVFAGRARLADANKTYAYVRTSGVNKRIDAASATAEPTPLAVGSTYNISIKKSGSNFVVEVNGEKTNVTSSNVALSGNTLYVGAYVSRAAYVKFTNLRIRAEGEVEVGDWQFGNTMGGPNGSKYQMSADENGNATLTVKEGVGKFSDGEYSIGYYVQPIDADADFTLSGKVNVNAFNTTGASNPQQSSFGAMIMNDLFVKKDDNDADTGRVTAYGVFDAMYVSSSKDSTGTIAAISSLSKENIKANRVIGDSLSSPIAVSGENLGTYDLKIVKSGTNYKLYCGDNTYTIADDDECISGDGSGKIYPGFFVARDASITVSDISLVVNRKKAVGVTILSQPNKKEYYYGEALDTTGLKVAVKYEDMDTGEITEEEVSLDDVIITGYDKEVIGRQTVKVASGSVEGTFQVTVNPLKVTGISITRKAVKTTFNVGALFDPTGTTVTARYENGTSATLKASEIVYKINGKTYDSTTALDSSMAGGRHTVQVSRLEEETVNPNGIFDTYEIEVTNATLESIYVANKPGRVIYYIGDKFEQGGLVVRGVYSDGSEANLSDIEYTVSGYDSDVASTKTLTVTYTANTNITTTFDVYVYNYYKTGIALRSYPKTTYEVGEEFSKDGIVVVYTQSNNIDVPAEEGVDYTIDLSEFNAGNGTPGTVNVRFIPTNTSLDTVTIPVTIKAAEAFIWRGAIFGQSSSGASSEEDATESNLRGGKSEVIVDNEGTLDGKITIRSWHGAGKVTGDHDGMAYYYTVIPDNVNFSITADIYVVGYLGTDAGPYNQNEKRNGQEAFGIMARDAIPLKAADGSRTVNPAEAMQDPKLGPVPLNTGAVFSSNMVLAGGFSGSSYPADPTASSYQRNVELNKINLVARTGVDSFTDGAGTKIGPYKISSTDPKAGIWSAIDDTVTSKLSGYESDETQKGDTYRINLKRINLTKNEASGTVTRGFAATCTNLGTGETMTEYIDDATANNMFTVLNDKVYVGFFAARWATINVTNVDFYTSNPMTDPVTDTNRDEEVIPSVNVSSSLYTNDVNYILTVKTNNDSGGYITVVQNGNTVYSDREITTKTTKLPLTLVPDSTNVVTLAYTPSKADKNLSSYDTVTRTVNIIHKSNGGSQDVMYVSPTGNAGAEGTENDPLDLITALGFVESNQTIIMLDGVYENAETIQVGTDKSGLYGTITLKAAEGAHPVIDFMDLGNGFELGASYWHIIGIGFKGCGNNQHAMNIGGNYNTIENCTYYDNLGSGCQISRTSSSQEEITDWPSYNLVLNCETYNCADPSLVGADGFAAKLTVGYGNMFKGCISHHNADDGWDLYTKIGSGAIGPVVLEDCISYKQGYRLLPDGTDEEYKSGGHNGFKMGGENVAVPHYLKDCKSFMNDTPGSTAHSGSGLSSNSNPAMKIRNFIAYNNDNSGINVYSDMPERYNYDFKGIVSYKNGSHDIVGTYLNRPDIGMTNHAATDLNTEKSNYFLRSSSTGTTNCDGEAIADSFFKSLDMDAVLTNKGRYAKNADGSFITGDFLERKTAYVHEASDLVDLPGVDGIHRNGYGDPKVHTTTTTTERPTQTTTKNNSSSGGSSSGGSSSGGSSGGGSSSGKSSSNASKESNSSASKNQVSARPVTPSTPSTSSGSRPSTPSASNSHKATVNGVRLSVPAVNPNSNINFTDTATRAWANDAINKLASAGIINGVSANNFAPDSNIKRGDFMVMLVRTLGIEGSPSSNFSDVNSSMYYSNAIGLAKDFGVTSGIGNNEFNPEGSISRQDMMVLVARTLDLIGVDTDKDESVLNGFADSSNIAPYARPYIAALVNAGIVSGSGSALDATSEITRAQTAVMMSNVYDIVLGIAQDAEAAEAAEAAAAEEENSEEEAEESEEDEESDEDEEASEEDEESEDGEEASEE